MMPFYLCSQEQEQGKQQQLGLEGHRNTWVVPFEQVSADILWALDWNEPT